MPLKSINYKGKSNYFLPLNDFINQVKCHLLSWNSAFIFTKRLLQYYLKKQHYLVPEATIRRCSTKYVFLNISQNSQENNCVMVSFLIKQQTRGLQLH